MPIYEYSCEQCGKEFEELVFDEQPPVCPHCGSGKTHKLMSRCAYNTGGNDYAPSSSSGSGGCAGCSGGNCASCGH